MRLAGGPEQLRVLEALVLRETRTRFGTHQLGYLWALIEPVLWVLTFYGLSAAVGREPPGGMDLIGFMVTGIVPFQLFSSTMNRAANAIDGNKSLLFYPQVRPLDLVVARALLELATLSGVFVILMAGNAMIVGSLEIDRLLAVIGGLVSACMLGAGLGLTICSLSVMNGLVRRLHGPMTRPMFWLSGVFFTAESLPSTARSILSWNPLMHAIELTRSGWYSAYSDRHVNIIYLSLWVLGLAFCGLTIERVARRKLEVV